jgi:SAM-dependent methyltransferase
MTARSLRQLYESSATSLHVGAEPARYQAAILADMTSGATRPLRALDLGCGDGMTALAAVDACSARGSRLQVVGLDWSSMAIRQARRNGFSVARSSVEAPGLPIANASVDVVLMSEMIEHLIDTDTALAEAHRVLVPGGSFVCSTPNLAAWYNRVLLAVGVQPAFTEVSLNGIYGRPGQEVVGHLRIFTRRALVELLGAKGFTEVRVMGAPYHDVPRGFKNLDRLLSRVPSISSILIATARKPRQP